MSQSAIYWGSREWVERGLGTARKTGSASRGRVIQRGVVDVGRQTYLDGFGMSRYESRYELSGTTVYSCSGSDSNRGVW